LLDSYIGKWLARPVGRAVYYCFRRRLRIAARAATPVAKSGKAAGTGTGDTVADVAS
jgi:hypothetical protein